jgi:RND family efflux transporter MFP subunit
MKRLPGFVKTHKRLSLVILGLIIIIGSFLWPKPPAPLETQAVKKGDITETLSTTGNIISQNSVDLTFSSPGKLVYLNAKKGDAVRQGQVIATLDQRTVQKNLESSLKDYSKERNTFDQTRSDKNAPTPNDAVNDSIKRILQNNQYDLDKAVISVELQTLAKEQSVLTTPISGIVTRADVSSPGVNVGATTTFTVADPTHLIFRIEVDEADIGKVRPGQQIRVILDSYPNQPMLLTIDSIDFATHKTDTGGNAFYVDADLQDNSDLTYRIGMTGDGEIVLSEATDVMTIPLSSIADEKYVYVKTKNGFEKREVKLGISSDTDSEVQSGLQEGDQVAIDPAAAELRTNNKKKLGIF